MDGRVNLDAAERIDRWATGSFHWSRADGCRVNSEWRDRIAEALHPPALVVCPKGRKRAVEAGAESHEDPCPG
ncbi:hypothetical protein ABZ816_05710 [Actinosynnema sp. NPDC047251]|uniref:hypothetical protein n=1 Tax=Saccharothrix espanaensis TaxID=103731 RepID=UPI0011DD1548|nr:hypothetical protein [Saccharothrix espanaensis]